MTTVFVALSRFGVNLRYCYYDCCNGDFMANLAKMAEQAGDYDGFGDDDGTG